MIRGIFNILAAVSLVLCAATLALWLRSCFRMDLLSWQAFDPPKVQQRIIMISSIRCGVEISFMKFDYGPGRRLAPAILNAKGWSLSSDTDRWPAHPGYGWVEHRTQSLPFLAASDDVNPKTVNAWSVGARLWLLSLLAAILPAIWLLVRVRRYADRRRGRCAVCGYDLRATPERCPECGAIPPKHTTQPAT